jgi:hypothetical protein
MMFLDIFCLAEVGFVITISSSPIIRPVLNRMFRGFRSISKGNEGSQLSDSVPAAEGIVPSILESRWFEFVGNRDLEPQDIN